MKVRKLKTTLVSYQENQKMLRKLQLKTRNKEDTSGELFVKFKAKKNKTTVISYLGKEKLIGKQPYLFISNYK